MIRIVFKNLTRRKSRTLLTMIGIIIGVAAIVGLVSVSEGLQHEATSALGSFQSITVTKKDSEGMGLGIISRGSLPADYEHEIDQIQGVSVASPVIRVSVNTIDGDRLEMFDALTSYMLGVNPTINSQLRSSYLNKIIDIYPVSNCFVPVVREGLPYNA